MIRDPRPAAEEIKFRIERLSQIDPNVDLSHHALVRDVVERCIEVISEASRRLPDPFKTDHPEIPWQAIADIGNVIRHGYDRVAEAPLRQILTDHLRPLDIVISAYLLELDGE